MKTVGYIRVSSKEQNLDRQKQSMIDMNISDKYIYEDKQSGKNFDRTGYQYMIKQLEKGDLLVIHSLDRLGRDYKEIIKEWKMITDTIGADIKVLDMELLDTTKNKDLLGTFISDLILQVLSYVAQQERENINKRQSEGIASAKNKGVKFGRPVIDLPSNFKSIYDSWKAKEITGVQAMNELQMSKATFYRKVKEYENSIQ